MDISIDQLLQIIGEEHVKAVLLAKQVEQLRQIIEELRMEGEGKQPLESVSGSIQNS